MNAAHPAYPGIPAIIDGSEAVAHVETRLAEACCAYPITPSTNMATLFQAAVADGKTNLWGTRLSFLEPESEHSSASAAEGFALAGGRVTNFTAGQGLLLMKEVLFTISGKRLPAVFHVGARALTSQSLNIHAGHDDVMSVADAGWGILFARNVQEAADLTAIARRVAEETETPFLVVQDGFLTTHTLENALLPEDELLREFVGDPRLRIRNLFEPSEALMTGVVQNQDSYMKGRVAQRAWYERIPAVMDAVMNEWAELTGRRYGAIDAYLTREAEHVVVSMGTIADSARDVVDHLRATGVRAGGVTVTSFRPFPATQIAAALADARSVAIVERTDEPAAAANPLTRETKSALADLAAAGRSIPRVVSASAGLGSRDVASADLLAVFDWLRDPSAMDERPYVVLGIKHRLGLAAPDIELRPTGAYSLRGHSIGGYGSVTVNKLLASIVGQTFGLYVQAYPRYGSEKRGLPTTYYLTTAESPIRQHSELRRVEFVPLHDVAAFGQGAPLSGLVDGGTLFVNSTLDDPAGIWAALPANARAEIIGRGINVVALDTLALAKRFAPTPNLATRMQGAALVGVFLRVAPFIAGRGLSLDDLMAAVKGPLAKHVGKRGGAVVDANLALIRAAYEGLIDVTAPLRAAPPQAAGEGAREMAGVTR
ncbi:MAG TPA: 2-oxoacid:acceptor oxidoreductase family protein [Candidatus Limnocylindrales bacterium]